MLYLTTQFQVKPKLNRKEALLALSFTKRSRLIDVLSPQSHKT